MSHSCTLAGIALTGHQTIRWARQGGVAPFMGRIMTTRTRAEKIFAASKGVGIELELNGNLFQNLWVIGLGAGDSPTTRTLTVADWRWALPRIHLTFDANLQRTSIERRLRGSTLETAVQTAAQVYAPHSLRNDRPYTAVDVLRDVAQRMVDDLEEVGIKLRGVLLPAAVPTIEVVSWSLDAPGDEAVGKLLTLMPGLQLEADADGNARFYLETGLDERGEVTGAFVFADGGQYPLVMDRSRFRPGAVHVQFEKRLEERLNYDEVTAFGAITTQTPTNPGWDLVNLVQVKEPSLVVDGREVGYGSWVPFNSYITALAAQTRPLAAQNDLCAPSLQWVREHFCSGFTRMRACYVAGANGSPDPLWNSRFDTILAHYRQTFAVSAYWYDRLLGIEAIRTSVYDPVQNVHAPAEAYCNYTLKPTWRQLDPKSGGQTGDWCSIFETAYTGGTLNQSKPAPFAVEVEDRDAMIIRLVPRPELSRQSDAVFPGVPTASTRTKLDSPVQLNNLNGGLEPSMWEYCTLTAEFKLAVVLTCGIAMPNSRERYHEEKVLPAEAQAVIKACQVGVCTGPALYIKVDPALIEARGSWVDSSADQIQACAVEGGPLQQPFFQNPESVRDVAIAVAAGVYESLVDRISGERVRAAFKPLMAPTGALNNVTHELEPSGRLSTSFSFAQMSEPRSVLAYLPMGTRRLLQRANILTRSR